MLNAFEDINFIIGEWFGAMEAPFVKEESMDNIKSISGAVDAPRYKW